MRFINLIIFSLVCLSVFSQEEIIEDSLHQNISSVDDFLEEEVIETFNSTRIINGHSVETLKKGVLDFRIEHKFGDLAGSAGGINTLFGLDNVSDIRIAFEYGVSDKFMIGFGRSRGAGVPYRSLLDGLIKYRILHQDNKRVPISLAFIQTISYSYMPQSSLLTEVSSFPKYIYRFAYCSQMNFARKLNKRINFAIMPTFIYRNFVASDDVNALFSLGSALNYAINSKVGITVEYYNNFQKETFRSNYKNSLSFAVDWITFGHTFKVYLSNSAGFGETQFIPYTNTNWLKGQFRLGFCISRKYIKE